MGWGKKAKDDDDDDNVIPLPLKCPPHMPEPTYDEEGEIIGSICLKCGEIKGRLK